MITVMTTGYLAPLRELLERPWPANRTVNLVFHGHSVPSGYFDTPVVRTLQSYPHLIVAELTERFPYAVINSIVTAIGGEHSGSGAARFDAVLDHRPDVIFLDYALNDRSIGLDQAREAWTSMIIRGRQAGARIVLLTPTADQRSDLLDPEDDLARHAEQVRGLAAEHGTGLIDSYAAFQAAVREGVPLESLMSHVNHPNEAGHRLIAEAARRIF